MITTSAFNAGDEGSIPGGAVKIPHVSQLKNQNVPLSVSWFYFILVPGTARQTEIK